MTAAPSKPSTTAPVAGATTAAPWYEPASSPPPTEEAKQESASGLASLPWFFWLLVALAFMCVGGLIACCRGQTGRTSKVKSRKTRSSKSTAPTRGLRMASESASREEMEPLVEEYGTERHSPMAAAVPQHMMAHWPQSGPQYSAGPMAGGFGGPGLLMPQLQFMPNLMPNMQLSSFLPGSAPQAPQHLYSPLAPSEMYGVPQQRVMQQPRPLPAGHVVYAQPVVPGPGARVNGATAFDAIDANHDGVITRAEFNQAMRR